MYDDDKMPADETVPADLLPQERNPEEVKKAKESLLIKEGWYTSEAPTSVKVYIREKDGRKMVNPFFKLLTDEGDVAGYVGSYASPEIVYNDTGRADFLTEQFFKLEKVYEDVMGQAPKTDQDTIDFIANNPIRVKVTKGKDQDGTPSNSIRAFAKVRVS